MKDGQLMKIKICLVGEQAVGKTSLIRRYVLNEFDDRYITTLGAKVSKKEFDISIEGDSPIYMDMTIWDIMGSKGFRELLREAYFQGAQGILAVCDITRRETIQDLDDWVESVYKTVEGVPVVFAANKFDLKEMANIDEEEIKQSVEAFESKYFFTSAKTGYNVEPVFLELAKLIIQRQTGQS